MADIRHASEGELFKKIHLKKSSQKSFFQLLMFDQFAGPKTSYFCCSRF